MHHLSVRLILALAGSAGLLLGQAGNNNPASRDAPVFLDNHGSSVKKGKEQTPTSRNLSGKVVDVNGDPLEGALVTLVDTAKQTRTTFITKADGRYRFDGLSFTNDYGLEAKYRAFASEPRKISQYDRNASPVRILQIDESTPTAAENKKKS